MTSEDRVLSERIDRSAGQRGLRIEFDARWLEVLDASKKSFSVFRTILDQRCWPESLWRPGELELRKHTHTHRTRRAAQRKQKQRNKKEV